MNKQAYLEKLKELAKQDPSLALFNAFANEYHKDSLATEEQLLARAKAYLGTHEGLEAVATGKNVSPLTQAFDVSEEGLRRVIDPKSSSNWMNMSSSALLKAGIKGGYIRDIPVKASPLAKEKQREEFGKFLGMLAKESNDQAHRNAVAEYENTKFTKDPIGWAQKGINDILFRTYSKRAMEQALNGEGAASWGDMSAQDRATLGTDILANTAYGAGGAGLSSAIAKRGIMGPYAGLRTAANLYGSDLAAGALGGTADVLNRSLNTRAGVMPYEYLTEPVAGGVANAVMTPGMLRSATSQALSFLGGGRTGDVSRRGAMQKVAEWVANRTGWDEAELARKFKELGGTPDYATAPLSSGTRQKIAKMKEIWDDGMTDSPGQFSSLFDELQYEYERNVTPAISGWNKKGEAVSTKDILPTTEEFIGALDNKIAELKGEYAVAAGHEEAPALKRKIDYFENARDMFGTGLMNPHEVLYKTEPAEFVFNNRPTYGAGSGKPVEFKDPHTSRDLNIMKDFVYNANTGLPVNVIDHPMADEIMRLSTEYPEFGRYVQNMSTKKLKEEGPSLWSVTKDWTYGDRIKKGVSRKDVSLSEAALSGIVKPVAVVEGKEYFNRPDDSFEAVQRQYEELKSRKPVAAEAALNWKYDPKLDEKDQLNSEERNLVNKYRKMMQEEAMNGR